MPQLSLVNRLQCNLSAQTLSKKQFQAKGNGIDEALVQLLYQTTLANLSPNVFTILDLRSSGPAANSSTMGQLRARRKAAKMLVAVVVMFASCFFPVHVLNILR